MVAHWQDGSTWAVPQQTVGQHKRAKDANKIEAFWEGTKDDATISLKTSTSKDKSWLIIWSQEKGKRIHQVLQLVTHVLPTDKMPEAIQKMQELAEAYVAGDTKEAILMARWRWHLQLPTSLLGAL